MIAESKRCRPMITKLWGQKYCDWLLGISLGVTVIFICILAWVPPVSRDALTHHLYVPKLYLKAGCIHEIPHISFSYYPQLLDLLYIIPLYFKNDILPKYIHFSFAIAASVMIYLYLKKKFDKRTGLAGSFFFLTIPVIVKLSVTVYVDLGLIFFTFASIVYLFKWKNSELKWRYLMVSGTFTGLAMGTKYNGILSLITLTLLLPLLIPKQQRKALKSFLYPVAFALIALSVFSPWMIKNYLWTGNPLYPVYKMKIQLPEENTETEKPAHNNNKKKRMNHLLIRKHVYHEKWWETLSIPVRIFFQGEDDNPALFDGRLNPFLFIIPLILLFLVSIDKKKMDVEIKFLILFSTLYVILVFLKTDMRIRYVSPIIPPLVIVYAAGIHKIREYFTFRLIIHEKFINLGIVLIFCLSLSVNLTYAKALFLHINPVNYISGKTSRTEYINRFRPEYGIIEYLNKHVADDSKVLALFLGNRGYYFKNEVRFNKELFFNLIKSDVDETEIVHHLKQNGFTHLIVGFDLFKKWIQNNLKQEESIKLKKFFDIQAVLIKYNGCYGLYQLK